MGNKLCKKSKSKEHYISIFAEKSQCDLTNPNEKARWDDFDLRIQQEKEFAQSCYTSQNNNYTTQILWIAAGVLSILFLRTFQVEHLSWALTWAMIFFASTIVLSVLGYFCSEQAFRSQLKYINAYQSGDVSDEIKYRKNHSRWNRFNMIFSVFPIPAFTTGFIMLGIYIFN